MTTREEFEKWASEDQFDLDRDAESDDEYESTMTQNCYAYFCIRQPEIDALKAEVALLKAELKSTNFRNKNQSEFIDSLINKRGLITGA